MSILNHYDYRIYLKELMAEKARQNPRFSMRAMAKNLSLAPSFLSGVLKGKKNFSLQTATKVARKLRLNKTESEYFCLLTQRDSAKDALVRESLVEQLNRFNPNLEVSDLSVDRFRVIADWFHFAILAAMDLSAFEATPRNLALALETPQAEIELALARLLRLNMIEEIDTGIFIKVARNPRVSSAVPDGALRQFHAQTLQKAVESLTSQSPKEKIVGSETMAFDSDQVEALNVLANEFFDRALMLAKKSKRKDCVYHLGVQFFNFTPRLRRKEEN